MSDLNIIGFWIIVILSGWLTLKGLLAAAGKIQGLFSLLMFLFEAALYLVICYLAIFVASRFLDVSVNWL